jgi:acetylornithine deacetylase
MDELIELINALVAIDSVNPDLVPGGGGETAIARFVANWLEGVGLEVTIEEAVPGRPNVVGVLKGTGGGQSLMLNAHMDTVGVVGVARPFKPFIEQGDLYGRGAYDMKASLAAIMLAVKNAAAKERRGDVLVTAVCDEEYASIGTQAIVKKWKADAAIITEPTELKTCIAHRGFMWMQIVTHGRAAHGSRPDLGLDAITKMGKFLVALEKHGQELLSNPSHRLLDSGSVHASLIRGGQELSSYPDRCILQIERRTVPGESTTVVTEQIQALFDEIQVRDGEFRATYDVMMQRPAFEVDQSESIVATVQKHATDVLGKTPEFIGAPFWMDSAILAAAGIPTVIFGPAGGGAHAIEEWVDLESVSHCMNIYQRVIEDFCA